jgi:hypothetical protein
LAGQASSQVEVMGGTSGAAAMEKTSTTTSSFRILFTTLEEWKMGNGTGRFWLVNSLV